MRTRHAMKKLRLRRRILSLVFALTLMLSCLTACGSKTTDAQPSASDKKLQIVTTIFPEYDWVKQILGDQADQAEVTMLLDNGVDLHSYQPTTEDMLKISNCDVFIYVGGESDKWVDKALKQATNKDMKVINLMEIMGDNTREEEIVEGMQAEEEEGTEEEEGSEYDEHVWLSLKNAKLFCKTIADTLAQVDTENADTYQANAAAYEQKLTDLDEQYQEAVNNAAQKTLLFGDRFPFRYMVDDYGLKYYAAFVGCSAETEASFATVTFLAGKVDELHLKYVMTIEKSDHKIADAIIQNTKTKNQQILTLDSMQSTTSDDVANGTTYLSVMQNNLTVLEKALQDA